MNSPPPLPNLPPLATTAATTQPLSGGSSSRSSRGFPGTRRFRQMLGAVAGGGLALTIGILTLEGIARPGLRPSDGMATIEARIEAGIFNQKMGAAPGVMKMTEAEYQAAMAEAQRAGQAKAEIEYQKELAKVEADKQIMIGAYQTLYQRTVVLVQGAVQLAAVTKQMKAQLIAMSNGGRNVVISFSDILCGLGSPESCESAKQRRREMVNEAEELSAVELEARAREIMDGIDDPATLMAKANMQPTASAPAQ